MKKVFGQTVRDLKREVNKKVLKVPGVEQKVLDATSNEPWGPHGSLLADIAMATRNYHELQMIMSVIWKRLSDTGKNWRHVYKGLAVLEYLVAHGSERVIDEIKEHAYQISMLSDFLYIDSSGRDQGTNVRKKSQSLVALVNDKERIMEVREKAAANRDKFRNTPTGGMYRPDSGGYGDKYDYDRYEGRYGSRDEDRSSYGREREYGYGDDRYSRDGDRYGRDGYRDDDYRGRSRGDENYQYGSRGRSSDRERAYEEDGQSSTRGNGARADDQSQDESLHERKFPGQNNGAPPSYEEAVSESQSPVHGERTGETSIASAPKAASPIASDHPSQANYTADNSASPIKEGEVFDEFDPRSSTSASSTVTAPAKAVPAASTGAEFDLLGHLSDDPFSSNAMPTLPSTGEIDAQANPSAVPSFTSSHSMTNADSQAFDDPFGDGPFRATTPTQSAIAHEQTSTSVPSFQASSTNSHFLPQELTSSNQDIDILADILPPSGPSDAVASQTPFSAPTSQPSQPGPTDQPSQPGGNMYGQPGQAGPNMVGLPALQGNDTHTQPTQPTANLFDQPGQPIPSSQPSANPYSQQPQSSASPYNQMAQPGANPYGQQAQPGANPYGQQAQPGANPYGQQLQTGANPYGQQAQPGANPYGQQAQPGANPYGQQAEPGANPYGQQAQPSANGYSQPAQSGANPYGQLGQPNMNNTYGGYNPQPGPGSIVPFGLNTTPSSGSSVQSGAGGFSHAVPTSPINPQMAQPQSPAAPGSIVPFGSNTTHSVQSSAGGFSHGVPTSPINPQMAQPQSPAAPASPFNGGNIISQQGSAAQSVGSSSTGALAILPQASKEKFEPKSAVWADTLSRGLVNLNISGPKTNPLADIGVDFDAINRKEKRMEKTAQTPVTSTITMGKAMGSGTGMGRAGASALRPAPNPMVSPGMGMGANMGMNPGMGMGANMGMNPGMGMGANMGTNPGMGMGPYMGTNAGMGMGGYGGMNQQPMGMGMGPNMRMNPGMGMNMGMGQGFQMQPQTGMPQGSNMQGNYNPMMGQGGYPPQQQFGGGYR